jgi:hypothetical protein
MILLLKREKLVAIKLVLGGGEYKCGCSVHQSYPPLFWIEKRPFEQIEEE